MTHILETPRLNLYLIAAEDLITLYEKPDNTSIYLNRPYLNPHRVLIDIPGPLRWRVPQVKEDPSLNIWFVRWIVEKKSKEIIGSISFHGKPNEVGMIEIGLGIESGFRNMGYGFEALKAMWLWAIDQPGVLVLRYTVSASNEASVALVNKFGFRHIGQQFDVEDGFEEIYEMTSANFRHCFIKMGQ